MISSFEDFQKKSMFYFIDDYFIDSLTKYLEEKLNNPFLIIKRENIKNVWESINWNKIILVKIDDDFYVIEYEDWEFLDYSNIKEYKDYVENLINSYSFQQTHLSITYLRSYIKYLNNNEIEAILNAVLDNNQIWWIIDDEDVREFVLDIFNTKSYLLSEEKIIELNELLWIKK